MIEHPAKHGRRPTTRGLDAFAGRGPVSGPRDLHVAIALGRERLREAARRIARVAVVETGSGSAVVRHNRALGRATRGLDIRDRHAEIRDVRARDRQRLAGRAGGRAFGARDRRRRDGHRPERQRASRSAVDAAIGRRPDIGARARARSGIQSRRSRQSPRRRCPAAARRSSGAYTRTRARRSDSTRTTTRWGAWRLLLQRPGHTRSIPQRTTCADRVPESGGCRHHRRRAPPPRATRSRS